MIFRRHELFQESSGPLTKQVRCHLDKILILFVIMMASCDMAPVKPEEVFVLCRERINSGNFLEARKLVSANSLNLVKQIEENYKLDQTPEHIVLFNIIDPVAPPILVKADDVTAVLELRTLKGGKRRIGLTRADQKSPWKVDITDELKSLQSFLVAREALSSLQQQAGEFAASWRALENQLQKMGGPAEHESQSQALIKDPAQKNTKSKPSTKQLKKEDKSRAKDGR
ncbi:MAG: hypothetical protein V1897_13760 [Pseudomonadota bacterium]